MWASLISGFIEAPPNLLPDSRYVLPHAVVSIFGIDIDAISAATRRKYQAGMRIPRRLRMAGMTRKKLIRSRSVAAAGESDKVTQQSRQGHRNRSTLARPPGTDY